MANKMLLQKAKYKRYYYCFVAAIQGPNQRVFKLAAVGDRARLVLGTVWVFCLTKKGAHKGDYHKVFNSKNYLQG
jgi:hypothetical protein